MTFDNCTLQPLTEETAAEITQWEYPKPYDSYSLKGRPNGYLLDKKHGEQNNSVCAVIRRWLDR